MTPNPPSLTQDILVELRNMNKSVNMITSRLKQALDPMDRLIGAFTKAADMQVKAVAMGFKSAGFKDSFDNVSKSLDGIVPSLDSLEIAASLFEGGLKEVNKKKGDQLVNKGLVRLAANLTATGKDFRMVSDVVLPLTAELGLNTEKSNKLAENILKLNQTTGMSVDSIINLTKSIPGKDAFALLGVGDDFMAAGVELKAMFKDLAPQIDKVFETFFEDIAEGERLSRTLGIYDEFQKALAAPSKKSLSDFLEAASKAGMGTVTAALQSQSMDAVGRIRVTQQLSDAILGDRKLIATFNALNKRINELPMGLLTELPEKTRKNMATAEDEFKNSVLNRINLVFDPLEKAMKELVPLVTQNGAAFQELLNTIGFGLAVLNRDLPKMFLYTVGLPAMENLSEAIKDNQAAQESFAEAFAKMEVLKEVRESLTNYAQEGIGILLGDFMKDFDYWKEKIFPKEITPATDEFGNEISPYEPENPEAGAIGSLVPLVNPKSAMPDQLAISLQKQQQENLIRDKQARDYMENSLAYLKRISETNDLMAFEKKAPPTTRLEKREGNVTA